MLMAGSRSRTAVQNIRTSDYSMCLTQTHCSSSEHFELHRIVPNLMAIGELIDRKTRADCMFPEAQALSDEERGAGVEGWLIENGHCVQYALGIV